MALLDTLKQIEQIARDAQFSAEHKLYLILEQDLKELNEAFGNLRVDLFLEEAGHRRNREASAEQPGTALAREQRRISEQLGTKDKHWTEGGRSY